MGCITDFLQRTEIRDFSLFSFDVDFPQPDIVITSTGCKAALSMRFKMGRIDWGIPIVPGDQER